MLWRPDCSHKRREKRCSAVTKYAELLRRPSFAEEIEKQFNAA